MKGSSNETQAKQEVELPRLLEEIGSGLEELDAVQSSFPGLIIHESSTDYILNGQPG